MGIFNHFLTFYKLNNELINKKNQQSKYLLVAAIALVNQIISSFAADSQISLRYLADTFVLLFFASPPGHTCVLRPGRKSALTGWENLQFYNIRSAGK